MLMSVGVGVGVGTANVEPLVVAHPRQIASRARRGVAAAVVVGSVGFLIAYTTLQLLHARAADPAVVVAIAWIPLFARFAASALCGLAVGALTQLVHPDAAGTLLRGLPALFAAAIVLFAAVVVLFP